MNPLGAPSVPALLRGALFCGLLAFAAAPAEAEPMVITDLLGRSIRAEPIAVDGETVKIRREDGREFTLELKSLADEDQAKLRAWGATQAQTPSAPAEGPDQSPPKSSTSTAAASTTSDDSKPAKPEKPKYVPDMSKLVLGLSRFKGDTNTIAKFEGYSHRHEMWGYSFQITNKNLYAIEKVRLEYNLFARTFSDSSTPSLVAGSFDLPPIPSQRFETARTKTAEVCKRKGYYSYGGGGELRGVWVKLYVDGNLVQEQVTPESLKTEVSWTNPAEAIARPATRVIGDGYIY